MEKGLLGKFVSDGNFVEFCRLLFDAGVDFVKGDWSLDIVHQAVKRFLESPFTGKRFHEYFIARCAEGLEGDSGGWQ